MFKTYMYVRVCVRVRARGNEMNHIKYMCAKINGRKIYNGVIGDTFIYSFIYFIYFCQRVSTSNLLAYKSILFRNYFKNENENNINIIENFLCKSRVIIRAKCFTKTSNIKKIYSQLITS